MILMKSSRANQQSYQQHFKEMLVYSKSGTNAKGPGYGLEKNVIKK